MDGLTRVMRVRKKICKCGKIKLEPLLLNHGGILITLLSVSFTLAIGFTSVQVLADTWRGTAPFCAGSCLAGEVEKGRSDSGDGGYCITGTKVLCGNADQGCPVTSTQTSCYGAVMICENGHMDSRTQQWKGCNSYACGVCLGISINSVGVASGSGFVPTTCLQGYVWREATKNDFVCVIPQQRSQARDDNLHAGERRAGDGPAPDTCKQGFVWREATRSDHVCVTPNVRAAVAEDNRHGAERLVTSTPYGSDTCKQGFVWREAIQNDHVCVTPQTRAQATDDNSQAGFRRSQNGGPYGPDTCKTGFVWREVTPSDHVCVSASVREAVRNDNAAAASRRVVQP